MNQRTLGLTLIVLLGAGSNSFVAAQPEPEPSDPASQPGDEIPEDAAPDAQTPGEATAPEAEAGAEAPPAEATASAGSDETIIVTGTRIRKTSFAPSAPVEVIDRRQLERSGVKNLADMVQYMSATQGTGTQGSVVLGVAGTTASALNLRGLGIGATLVLVNGRRLNPAGAALGNAHFGDLATIPLAAIERIEILKAGASAIYGADAVGGVVNLITRRNWDGARIQVDGQSTSRWDHQEYTASAGYGAVSERSRILASMSYFRRTELNSMKREYGPDKFVAQVFPLQFVSFADGSRPKDPICMTNPQLCTNQYGQFIYLFPNSERANAFSNAEYDLNDHITAFAELGVSRFRGDAISLPSFGILTPVVTVPANHVDNPFGAQAALIGAPLGAPSGAERQTSSDDTFRTVLGLKGDFGAVSGSFLEEWEWELYGSFGVSRYRESIGDNLTDALQLALNSCSDPAALQNCFNPFYSAFDGTGTPNSRQVIDRFRSRQVLQADHALQTYNAGVSGTLFPLPGGDVGIALGGEVRREWRVTEFDHDSNLLRFGFLYGNTNNTAERKVYSGYLELRWPLIEGLELQTAARIERYTDTSTTAISPFAGLTAAIGKLQLRANVSRAFRAPTITNTYPGYGSAPLALQYMGPNPMPTSTYVAVRYYGTPELKPETAIALSAGGTWAPLRALQLNADFWYYDYADRIQYETPQRLVTEHEMALARGEVGQPQKVVINPTTRALTLINSNAINLKGSIVTYGLDFGLTVRVDGQDFGGSADDFGQFSLGGEGTYTMSYKLPRAEAGAMAAIDCDGPGDQDACEVAGKRNAYTDPVALPRLRANFPLVWTFKGHSASVIGHYISGFLDDVRNPVTMAYGDIAAWFTLDLQYGYKLDDVIGKDLTMRVGCQNLFDKLPPPVNGPVTYFVGEVHDPRGRLFYASLGAEF